MKTCKKCDRSKSLDEFHKSKRLSQGRRSWCKECERDQHKEWVKENPDKIAAIDRRFNQNNKEKIREKIKSWKRRNPNLVNAKRIKNRYGISMDQYRSMLEIQQHRCKICFRHEDELELGLHIDHNHSNGKVRGLLCSSCNQGIGLLKDSVKLLQLSIEYIKNDGSDLNSILEMKDEEVKKDNTDSESP